jgi:hypothetical protein
VADVGYGAVWAPATLCAVSTVVVGYAVNILTAGNADWWWWLVVPVGTLGLTGGAVWTFYCRKRASPSAPIDTGDSAGQWAGQQAASAGGTNLSITAEDGSAAAWQMGTVTSDGNAGIRSAVTGD